MPRWRVIGALVTTAVCTSVVVAQFPTQSRAEPVRRAHLSFYGAPGLIDTPTAVMQPDGQLSTTAAVRETGWRTAINFQATNRLSTTFQYTFTEDLLAKASPDESGDHYDRAFGFSYRFLDEGAFWPAMTVGITDLAGTGFFASEYVVATKHVTPSLSFTAGIGWGRLGSYGSFGSPFGERSSAGSDVARRDSGFNGDDWFRGPAAFFGGMSWQINDQWSFAAEYSSDGYVDEIENGDFERNSSVNLALNYRANEWFDVGVYSLYGSEFGIRGTITLNPQSPPYPGGREEAPPPVSPRSGAQVDLAAWGLPSRQVASVSSPELRATLAAGFESQKLQLVSLDIDGRTARVRMRNDRYDATPQAVGRAARVMAAILPDAVDTFAITPLNSELPTSTLTLRRSDLEELETHPERVWKSYVRTEISGPEEALSFKGFLAPAYPHFDYRVKPYISASLFDPDDPFRADAGAEFNLSYTPTPGMIFSGQYRWKWVGNRDESTRESDSVLPRVRSDLVIYDQDGPSYVSHLTGEYFFNPGQDLYGRVTAGYLERMYGGVSGEVLWKPVSSSLALGAEVNYAKQRDFDGGLGFQDYDIVTGHASAYYDIGNGYATQVDAGRYLAGDWGSTLTFSRDFDNGWRVGAFATLTDVSAEDFGEGSFDKGIFFQIPLSWISGEPSLNGFGTTIRPLTRDGGARLVVRNRLYGVVKGYQEPTLERRWGKFWR